MIREAILKRDKKSRALFILCMALYAAAFAGAIRSLIVFHWMGAFVMFIRLVNVAAHNSCQKWRTTHVKAYLCI